MENRIVNLPLKKLIGKKTTTSLANNKTVELWKNFMPHRNSISNTISNDLYSLQVYPPNYFNPFNPTTTFEKWALIEVTSFDAVPSGMETFTLPEGLYAIFNYKGSAIGAPLFFQKLFGVWLPSSGYVLDNRPHFEILGEKYKRDSEDSEEEVWIPIKTKV